MLRYLSIFIIVLILLTSSGMRLIKIDSRLTEFLPDNDSARRILEEYNNYSKEFYSEIPLLIAVEDAFIKENVYIFHKLFIELSELEDISFISSPFNAALMRRTERGIRFNKFNLPVNPDDYRYENFINAVNYNEFIRGTVLSNDLKDGCILIFFKDEINRKSSRELIKPVMEIIDSYRDRLSIRETGVKVIEAKGEMYAMQDLFILSIPSFLFIILMMFIFYKKISLTASVCIGLSVIFLLGLTGFCRVPINMVTILIPAVIMAVGSSYIIHFFNGIRELENEGVNVCSAGQVFRKTSSTIIPAALTTAAAFLSFTISDIKSIRFFGASVSIGILVFLVIIWAVFTVVYGFSSVKSDFPAESKNEMKVMPNSVGRFIKNLIIKSVIKVRLFSIVIFIAVVVSAFFYAGKINVNTNLTGIFDERDALSKNILYFNRQFNGFNTIFCTVRKNGRDSRWYFTNIESINKFKMFQSEIERDLGDKFDIKTFSAADILENIDTVTKGRYGIFGKKDLAGSILRLMKGSGDLTFDILINNDFSGMNMIIKSISKDGNLISDRDLIDIKNKINSVASSVYGDEEGIEWHVWGESIILSEMSDYLVKNQLFSIFLTLSVILIILVIYFKSFVIGLSGLIPLSFAIAVNILLMYFMKISLNVSTILTAGIVTGIGVDDFIHTVNCIRGNSEGAESFTGFSLYRPLSLSITPVIVTSLALSGSFLLFTLSRFKPVSNFGLLVSLSILSSTFANVYIVPAFSFLYVKKGQLETD